MSKRTFKLMIDGKEWRVRYRPDFKGKVVIMYEGLTSTHEVYIPGALLKGLMEQLPTYEQ